MELTGTSSFTNGSLSDLSDETFTPLNWANAPNDMPDGVAPHNTSEWYSYDHTKAPLDIASFSNLSSTSDAVKSPSTTKSCWNNPPRRNDDCNPFKTIN